MIRPGRLVLILLLLTLASLLAAPFTAVGTRALLLQLNRLDSLQVEYRAGTLGGELHLQALQLQLDTVTLRLQDIELALDRACLWRSALCLQQADIGQLSLDVRGGSAQPGMDSPDDELTETLLQLPVQLEADHLTLGRAELRWPGGSWRQGPMTAMVQLAGSRIDVLAADIEAPRLQLEGSGEESEPARLQLPRIHLPLALDVQALRLQQAILDLYGQQQALEHVLLRGNWRGTQLTLAALELQQRGTGRLELAGRLEFQHDWPLEALLDITIDEPAELEPLHGGSAELQLSGDFAALRAVAQLQTDLAVSAVTQVDVLDPELPFKASLEVPGTAGKRLAELLQELVDSPLGELQLQGPLAAQLSGNLLQQTLAAELPATGLGYEALSLQLAAVHREQQIRIETLRLRDEPSNSQLLAQGELDLGEDSSWRLQVSSEGLEVPHISDGLRGRLAGQLQVAGQTVADGWYLQLGNVSLEGEVNRLPAAIDGSLTLAPGGRLGPSDLRAEVNGAQLNLQSAGVDHAAHLELQVADLGRWLAGAQGQFALNASRPAGQDSVEFEGRLGDLQWQELEVPSGSLQGRYAISGDDEFLLQAALAEVTWAGFGLNTLELEAAGDHRAQQARLVSQGDVSGTLSLGGAVEGEEWRGTLAPATLTGSRGSWQLAQAVPLSWRADRGQLQVAGHCWQHPAFSLCPDEMSLGASGSAGLAVRGDLLVLNDFLPEELELSGQLDMQFTAAWEPGAPLSLQGRGESVDIDITRHFGLGESVSLGWQRAVADIERVQDGTRLTAQVEREGRSVLQLDLTLPDERSAALTGGVAMQDLNLNVLAPFMPTLSTVEGRLAGQLQLAGSVDAPLFNGALELRQGRFAALSSPTELEQLQLDLSLEGDRASIEGRGLLGGGELRLQGQAVARPEWRLQLEVSGERHNVFFPPATEAVLSQQLEISMVNGLLNVGGDITVHEGVARPDELAEGGVAVSGDVVEVDFAGNVLREERPFDTALDIRVQMRDRVKILSSGVRVTTGGELKVLQEPGRPVQLFGNLNVVGGELTAFRQRLEVRRGTVSFSGDPENPELDMRAERDIRGEGITVGAHLTGTVEDPRLEVYSDPAMSQSEAMSYLVRGRGLDAAAGADGTALALAIGADIANQSGILSEADRIPGVSNVSLGASGSENETAATISGYLGERIYLSYGIGVYEPINVMTARLYFNTRLWLEVVSRLENSVDLYYSFDID